jgi:hypothetical protein
MTTPCGIAEQLPLEGACCEVLTSRRSPSILDTPGDFPGDLAHNGFGIRLLRPNGREGVLGFRPEVLQGP